MSHLDAVDLARKLAEAQHGVVGRRQLLERGITADRIRSWMRSGRLVPRHRAVYTLGHALLTREGRWLAAVLACDERAVLSHLSAAALWGIRPAADGPVEVTVPPNGRRTGDGIRTRRTGIALPRFATRRAGIPVTTVAWTLLDLAAVLREHQLRRAVEEAERRRLFDLAAVDAALAADPGRPGSPALRLLLIDMHDHGVTLTRSDVEAAMLQLCIDHGLPRPTVNRYENGVEVDFEWPDHRLIVEVDGWAFHHTRRAFDQDRARDRRALAAGKRVARYPANEILRGPHAVAAELAQLLRRSAA